MLWPTSEEVSPAAEAMRRCVDGTPAAWAIEVEDAEAAAERSALTHERFTDEAGAVAYELVGWPEAVASRGVQPFFARYWPPLAGRTRRAVELWADDPGQGVARLLLAGDEDDRRRVEGLIQMVLGGSALDVELEWVAGPGRLVGVELVGGGHLLG